LFPLGVVEGGCLAHARRKFFDLWAGHKSVIAEQALKAFRALYKVEEELIGITDAEAGDDGGTSMRGRWLRRFIDG
jgi:hypothetical protein